MLLHRLAFLATLGLAACTAHSTYFPGDGSGGGEAVPKPPRPVGHREIATMQSRLEHQALAATTSDGAVVVLRASDGAELAREASSGFGGLIDLTHDVTRGDLVLYEENDEGEGAAIGRFPLTLGGGVAKLEPRVKVSWVDGVARLFATPEGRVSFEENIGQRWKLDVPNGGPLPSIACPRPASVAIVGEEGARRLVGVSAPFPDEGPLRRLEVSMGPSGLGECHEREIAGAPSSARLVVLPDGRELVVGVAGAGAIVSSMVDGVLSPELAVGIDAETVEQAIVVGEASNRIALLTSGPPRVIAIDLSTAGSPLSIVSRASIDLPADVRREQRFFSREMAFTHGRIFVATTSGIVAIDVLDGGSEPTLERAPFAGATAFMPNDYRGALVPLGSLD
jgi:hypothetical protein